MAKCNQLTSLPIKVLAVRGCDVRKEKLYIKNEKEYSDEEIEELL